MPLTDEEDVSSRERDVPGTESASRDESCDASGEKKAARHCAGRLWRKPADYKFCPLYKLEPFSEKAGIEILKRLYRGLTLEDLVIPDEDEEADEVMESPDDGA